MPMIKRAELPRLILQYVSIAVDSQIRYAAGIASALGDWKPQIILSTLCCRCLPVGLIHIKIMPDG